MDNLAKERAQAAAEERGQIVDALKAYRATVTAGIPAHVAYAFGEIVDGAIEAVTSMPEPGTQPNN